MNDQHTPNRDCATANDGPTERRRIPDRRAAAELGARLAVGTTELLGLVGGEAHAVTAMLREIELLRTPTAPDIQREHALNELRDRRNELAIVRTQIEEALAALERMLA